MITDNKDLVGMVETWNKLVRSLEEAKKLWGEFIGYCESRTPVHELNYQASKILAIVPKRGRFEIILPRLIAMWARMGGIEELVIQQEVELEVETKKEAKDGRRK